MWLFPNEMCLCSLDCIRLTRFTMTWDFPQLHTGEGIVSGLPHLCECRRSVCYLTHTNMYSMYIHILCYLTRWDWEPHCWKWQRGESGHLVLTFDRLITANIQLRLLTYCAKLKGKKKTVHTLIINRTKQNNILKQTWTVPFFWPGLKGALRSTNKSCNYI